EPKHNDNRSRDCRGMLSRPDQATAWLRSYPLGVRAASRAYRQPPAASAIIRRLDAHGRELSPCHLFGRKAKLDYSSSMRSLGLPTGVARFANLLRRVAQSGYILSKAQSARRCHRDEWRAIR